MNQIANAERERKHELKKQERDFRHKHQIVDKQLAQSERESKRAFAGQIIGSGMKGGADLGSAMLKGVLANHPDWYKTVRSIDQSVFTNISLFNPIGGPSAPVCGGDINAGTTSDLCQYIGGLLLLNYVDIYGWDPYSSYGNGGGYSDIMWALNNMVTQLREHNSRVGQYEPSELGLYLAACADIACDIYGLERAIALCQWYDANNRYAPLPVHRMLPDYVTIGANELRNQLQNVKARLETLIADFNANCIIPEGLTFLLRKIWLNSHVYYDGKSSNQLYAFRKFFSYKYNDLNNKLDVITRTTVTILTITQYLDNINERIQAIKDSPNCVTMQADMRIGFKDKYLVINLDDINPKNVIGFDDEVMCQIHNAISLPYGTEMMPSSTELYVNPNDGYLYQGTATYTDYPKAPFAVGTPNSLTPPQMSSKQRDANKYRPMLDITDKKFMNSDGLLIATRLRPVFGSTTVSTSGNTGGLTIQACGTELICSFTFLNNEGIGSSISATLDGDLPTRIVNHYTAKDLHTSDYLVNEAYAYLCAVAAFDYHPAIITYTSWTYQNVQHWSYAVLFDYYNPINFRDVDVAKVHRLCLINEFYLPESSFDK